MENSGLIECKAGDVWVLDVTLSKGKTIHASIRILKQSGMISFEASEPIGVRPFLGAINVLIAAYQSPEEIKSLSGAGLYTEVRPGFRVMGLAQAYEGFDVLPLK